MLFFFSPSGELNKCGEADTDTARAPPTDDDALDTSSTSSISGGSRHFQEHWLKLFPWIVHEDGKMDRKLFTVQGGGKEKAPS